MSTERHLKPTNDVAFKRIFGNEKHPAILIKFLNDLLGKKPGEQILSLEFISPNLAAEYASDKLSIVDVLVFDEKKTRYIVEVQVNAYPGFEKRAQFYAAKAYSGQAKIGGQYMDLKAVVFLAIVDFYLFDDEGKEGAHISSHGILDKKTHECKLDDLSFTFVELKKFRKTFEQLETDEDRWCYFLKNADKEELMGKLVKTSNPVFGQAYEELDKHYWSEKEIMRYDYEEKRQIDEFNVIMGAKQAAQKAIEKATADAEKAVAQAVADAEKTIAQAVADAEKKAEQAEEKGREEGGRERDLAIAKAALQKGLDVATIADLTGLSVQEIKALGESS